MSNQQNTGEQWVGSPLYNTLNMTNVQAGGIAAELHKAQSALATERARAELAEKRLAEKEQDESVRLTDA